MRAVRPPVCKFVERNLSILDLRFWFLDWASETGAPRGKRVRRSGLGEIEGGQKADSERVQTGPSSGLRVAERKADNRRALHPTRFAKATIA
jgi:hypothetical protein